ncbi:hypothetical protein TNCV_4663991 [Trichonephila clavipes]|nr:hypothetical protein TNCV_4663991 [Trichonephila clavipes]
MDIKQYNFINFSRLTLQGVASKNSYLIHFHAGIQKTRNFWNVLPVGFSTKTRSLTAAPVKEIGSPVGRNQTSVMRIWDHWMQEVTKDRRGRWHPPQCTTSREDRQIVHMAETDPLSHITNHGAAH